MPAYYNEHDPKAAAWLRELINRDLICVGDVDERSIEVVQPDDLRGYTQCHFFAGIGVWSHALRQAGWSDDRSVWTGSCPCQPFSAAGKGEGGDDPRHLWPAWFRLVRECRPVVVFGEQVESAIRHGWLDLVSADLEGEGYAIGSVVFGAHSVGAPHIRQRCYFVADHHDRGRQTVVEPKARRRATVEPEREGSVGSVAGAGQGGRRTSIGDIQPRQSDIGRRGELGDPESGRFRVGGDAPQPRDSGHPDGTDDARELGESNGTGSQPGQQASEAMGYGRAADAASSLGDMGNAAVGARGSGVRGFWSDAEWIACTDGKARPVEPGTFPLAHGAPARVGRLRGYGNALCAPQAQAFIEAYLDVSGR